MHIFLGLIQPVFSEQGTNKRKEENRIYGIFVKYIREVASKLYYAYQEETVALNLLQLAVCIFSYV